jgi:hypothetical protein
METIKAGSPYETTPDTLAKYLSDAWSGVYYWASDMGNGLLASGEVDPAGFTVTETEGGTHPVSWQKLADALAVMASGYYVDYAGARKTLAAYHVAGARTLLVPDDDGDYDAETWDTAIQIAALGKVIYG